MGMKIWIKSWLISIGSGSGFSAGSVTDPGPLFFQELNSDPVYLKPNPHFYKKEVYFDLNFLIFAVVIFSTN